MEAHRLNERDRWILDFLDEHEWATSNLIRYRYNDEHERELSRQQLNKRVVRLWDAGVLEKVHPEAATYRLVEDPRDD